jgi:hypothetical protein
MKDYKALHPNALSQQLVFSSSVQGQNYKILAVQQNDTKP